jgi:Fe(3+) dicitrate transport protein
MVSFFLSRRSAVGRTLVFLLFSVTLLSAQSHSAVVSGRVLDPSGAILQNARVTLRQPHSDWQRVVYTDISGAYFFRKLDPGAYELVASSPGFIAATRELTLGEQEQRAFDIVLDPGGFREEITVVGPHVAGTPEIARRVPGSVELIDEVTLENSRVHDFGEALRKIAGVNVRDEEGFGLRPNIGIRGLNPTRSTKVLLLEDGIPLAYAPYGDNSSYYHPPVERFSSVEILKGSGQILYGPATVGGVVNYITPDPPPQRTGSITLMGGSRDYFSGNLQLGGTWRGTGVLVDYLRKQGEGARENTRSGLNDFNLKSLTVLSPSQTLTVKANYYGEDSNVTYSGLRLDEYLANPRQNSFRNDFFYGDRWGASATHNYVFRHGLLLMTNVYGSVFKRNWWRQSSNSGQRPNDAADPACGGMENLNTTCGNEGRLRRYYSWGIAPQIRADYSFFGLRQQSDFGVRMHFERQDRRQENGSFPMARSGVLVESNIRENQAYSAFVQQRLHVGRLILTPGVRVERISYERTNRLLGVSGTTDLTQVVPGIGVSYSPFENATFFAGVHRGFAPPRTEDVINNSTGGVVDLDPELSWNYELGARTVPMRGLRLDATFFRMDYQNQIIPASLAGGLGAALTNGGETLHQGVELATRIDSGVLRSSRHNLYFGVAYTWLPVGEFTGVRFRFSGSQRDRTPPNVCA